MLTRLMKLKAIEEMRKLLEGLTTLYYCQVRGNKSLSRRVKVLHDCLDETSLRIVDLED